MIEKINRLVKQYNYRVENIVDVMGKRVSVPMKYSDASALMILFPAPIKKLEEFVNSPNRLKPIKIKSGKGLLGVTIFNYRDCEIGPFREFTFSIPVLLDTKMNIPYLPLVADFLYKKLGYYVVQLGANNLIAIDHIIKIFGYPIYNECLNIDLEEKDNYIRGSINENGRNIISIIDKSPKKYRLLHKKYNSYFIKNDELYNVWLNTFTFTGVNFCSKHSEVNIGDHVISDVLKIIGIESKPLATIYHKNGVEIASAPVKI